MSKASNQNLRVGLFIFGLVVLGATMLFFVGGASKLLEEDMFSMPISKMLAA